MGLVMKYTSPIYVNESVETKDVICASKYQIDYTTVTVVDPETGIETKEPATQIIVDINNLF